MNGTARPANDSLVNVGIGLVIAAFATLSLLRLAATLAARVSGLPNPPVASPPRSVCWSNRSTPAPRSAPRPQPIIYWTVVSVLAGLLATAGWAVWRATKNLRGTTDPRRLTGTATAGEITRTASPRTLRTRAKTLRPSLTSPHPRDVGYLLRTAKGQTVWATSKTRCC